MVLVPIEAIEDLRAKKQRRASRSARQVLMTTDDEVVKEAAMVDAIVDLKAKHDAREDKHAAVLTLEFALYTKCDMCAGTQEHVDPKLQAWYVWRTVDLVPEWAGDEYLIICDGCNDEELFDNPALDDAKRDEDNDEANEDVMLIGDVLTEEDAYMGWLSSARKGEYKGEYKTPPGKSSTLPAAKGYYNAQGVFTPYSTSTPTKPYVPKCTKQHFDRLDFETLPDFGYLRPASERGGKMIDLEANYALFFSIGWSHIDEPSVKLLATGPKKNPIPLFAEVDKSKWPPSAWLDWPDMKAPPKFIEKYIQWAFDEWKAGKSIQFGCFGGHGRTGTFLGALLLLADMVHTGQEAIEWVHDHYCKDAIESHGQELFLDDMAIDLYGTAEEKAKVAEYREKEGGRTPFGQGERDGGQDE